MGTINYILGRLIKIFSNFSKLRAPAGCVKYFTGTTGTVKSFNFEGQIMNQNSNYKTCVRQEAGYCMIAWMESATTSPDPFQVGATTATSLAVSQMQELKHRQTIIMVVLI